MPKRYLLLKGGLSEGKLEGTQANLQVSGCGRVGVYAAEAFERDYSYLVLRGFAAHVQWGGGFYAIFKLFQETHGCL
jgi:hypothetical protein